ncbi:response regulator transcription factor [Erwinia sp. Leaf53]|uniref:response regulator transcription factor n=1 Tax=Erwinia sp. Leaf53 TaxID=1736225 RepID=UPI0006FFE9A3|nr:response regulator [Erwinia sp. Leaf53]KQN55406.1 histidine kinase [Erwinia sp. Leaf53]
MQLSQRIIVVDDERSVRSGLTNLLQSEGFLSEAFDSAESLLSDEAAMANAALFIIDVQLKGMNGFELFINLTRRLKNPPGIIISGNGDESMHRYAIALGAIAFLPKPIEIDTLFEHILQAFSCQAARQ